MSSNQYPIGIYFSTKKDIKKAKELRSETIETGVIEYDSEYSPPSPSYYPMIEEYVLPRWTEKTNNDDIHPGMSQPSRKRPIIQDEYDEDNYTLARSSVNGGTAIRRPQKEIVTTKYGNDSLEKHKSC